MTVTEKDSEGRNNYSCAVSFVIVFVFLKTWSPDGEMVQLFYYETRGKCCRKVFSYHGYPARVLLFPYEGWAQPALITYWLLKKSWWSRSTCKIIEITGNHRNTAKAKMHDKGNGTTIITGRFKSHVTSPDFRMVLTTNVSNADFQMGYCVTGTVERGKGELQLTHYAMVKRRGY